MAIKYWRGGTGTWSSTSATNWSLSSGGPANTTAPTSSDDVVFDSLSHTGAYTVTVGSGATCKSISFVTSATVIPTFTGTAQLTINDGDFNLPATGVVWSYTGTAVLQATTASRTLNLNGVSVQNHFVFRGTGSFTYGLASAVTTTASLGISAGIFNTNGYSVAATTFNTNTTSGTVNLGSSTLTFSSGWNWTQAGVTLNRGTSSIRLTTNFGTFAGAGKTYYDVQFTYTNASFGITRISISGANTFASLTLGGFRSAAAINGFMLMANQTVTGTLTIPGGTRRACRTHIYSDTPGTQRTITAAAVSGMQDVDFTDIAVAGASAPWTGTGLGDCQNNTGITFDTPKTVYYVGATTNLLFSSANVWSSTSGGAPDSNLFPLAQDTVIIDNNYPGAGQILQTGVFNHGTIDLSQRTDALSFTPQGYYYGDWISGSGVTIGGAGQTLYFSKRGAQSITSAGKAFPNNISLTNLGGTVTLQDALTAASLVQSNPGTPPLGAGSIDDGGYNVTITGTTAFTASTINAHTLTINGTWAIPVNFTASTLTTPAGSGVISMTGANRTFAGADKKTWPTLNQASTSNLTITGNNKFANLTNTANGSIVFTAGTTNEFSAFSVAGIGGSQIGVTASTSAGATLKKPLPWNVGVNSTLTSTTNVFAAANTEGIDWLNVLYITGVSTVQLLTPSLFTNTQAFYSPTVASNSQDLVASLFTNSQVFYGPSVQANYTLAPALVAETDTFYAATVGRGPVALTPARYDNTQTFYAATVGRGAVALSPSLVTNNQTIYAATVARGAVTLSPGLLANTQDFYAGTVTRGAVTLLANRYDNAQTFYAPTVGRGAITLSPSLVTNDQQFYSPSVATGAVTLLPARFNNVQAFYTNSIAAKYSLRPSLVPSQGVIYAPSVAIFFNVQPQRLDNDSAFYAATVSVGAVAIEPSLAVNAQSFPSATITMGSVTLQAQRLDNAQVFHGPVVRPAAIPLAPQRVDNAQAFYAASVALGPVNLQPNRVNNAQTFFGATLQPGAVSLQPSLAVNTQVFYRVIVTPAALTLLPPELVNHSTLYEPAVTPGASHVLPQLFANSQLFYAAKMEGFFLVRPPYLDSAAELFLPNVRAFMPNDGSSARGSASREDSGDPLVQRERDLLVAADARRFIADNRRMLTATRGPIQ